MTAVVVVTVLNTVIAPLPPSCVFIGTATSCSPDVAAVHGPVPLTTERSVHVATVTAVLTLTSLETSTLTPLTSSSTPLLTITATTSARNFETTVTTITSFVSPTSTTSSALPPKQSVGALSGWDETSHQTGLALGISFAILLVPLIAWLIFAWRTRRAPFKRKSEGSQAVSLPLSTMEKETGAHLTGGAWVFPRRHKPKRAAVAAPFSKPTHPPGIVTEKVNGPFDSWTDTTSDVSRQNPQVARDLTGSNAPHPQSPYQQTQDRPFSGDTVVSGFSATPPSSPPTSPLPSLPLSAVLSQSLDGRYSTSVPRAFVTSSIIRSDAVPNGGPYESRLPSNKARDSQWSIQAMGSRSSLAPSEDGETEADRDPLDRVTGFEYLYAMPRGQNEGQKRKS